MTGVWQKEWPKIESGQRVWTIPSYTADEAFPYLAIQPAFPGAWYWSIPVVPPAPPPREPAKAKEVKPKDPVVEPDETVDIP